MANYPNIYHTLTIISMSKNKNLVSKKESSLKDERSYKNLLHELQSIISKGQYQACKAIDNIKVQTYWQLGERIVREELKYKDRADYGKYQVNSLSI